MNTQAAHVLVRERLISLALAGPPASARATLIVAPPGFGKTTLLAQISQSLQRSRTVVTWLNCTRSEAAPEMFVTALARRVDASAASTVSTQFGIGEVTNALAGDRDVALFVDNYEKASSQVSDEVLETLISCLPANAKVFVATRELPQISVSKLMADAHVRVLDGASLQFNSIEIEELTRDLPPTGAYSAPLSKCEGWPVMHQLLRLHASVDGVGFDRRSHAFEYLAEQVMAALSSAERSFLREISILQQIDSAVAADVSRRVDADRLMLGLLRIAPIVSIVDDDRLCIRLHSLLREFLQQTLSCGESPNREELHRRAALHWFGRGEFASAMYHAARAGSTELGPRLLEDAGGLLLNVNEGPGKVRMFLDSVPVGVARDRPRLRLTKLCQTAMEGIASNWPAEWERLEREATPDARHLRDLTMEEWAFQLDLLRLLTQIHETRQAYCESPWERIRKLRAQAITRQADEPRYLGLELQMELAVIADYGSVGLMERRIMELAELSTAHRFSPNQPWITFHIAVAALAKGNLPAAKNHSRNALSDISEALNTTHRRMCYATMGQVFYEEGLLELAIAHFEPAVEFIAPSMLSTLAYAFGSRARCKFALGRRVEAVQDLSHAYDWSKEEGLPRFPIIAAAVAADLLLQSGDLPGCEEFMARAQLEVALQRARASSDRSWPELEALVRMFVSYWLMTGKAEQAYRLGQEFAARSADNGRRLTSARGELLAARAALAINRIDTARLAATRAIDLTLGTRAVRVFQESGAGVLDLIRREAGSVPACTSEWIREVVATASSADAQRQTRSASLSPRESEVLVALSGDPRTKTVAKRLHLSYETVRHHLKNIYAKLGVHTRDEAIAEARRRQLII